MCIYIYMLFYRIDFISTLIIIIKKGGWEWCLIDFILQLITNYLFKITFKIGFGGMNIGYNGIDRIIIQGVLDQQHMHFKPSRIRFKKKIDFYK